MHHVPNIFSCRYSVRLYGDDGWDVYDRGRLIHHDLPYEEALWLAGELDPPPEDFPEYDAACSGADRAYQLQKEQSR
jgi:hypothetical protein